MAQTEKFWTDREYVLKNVYPTLRKREGNEEFLADKVWRPLFDLAVILRFPIWNPGAYFIIENEEGKTC